MAVERSADELFRILAENVPGAVYLCRNDDAYSMLYLSAAVEELTGRSAGDFLAQGVSFVDLYHPDDAAGIVPVVDAALEARRPFRLEYRLRHTDGTYRWIEEYGQGVWNEEDELEFLEGALFDVTDRRRVAEEKQRLEQQLVQAQKLESLGLLAGGIAHDFNNLLQAVLPNLVMTLEDIGDEDPNRELLEDALDAANRAAELTRQMLAYAGRTTPSPQTFDLAEALRDYAPLLGKQMRRGNFQSEIPSDPVWVDGDPTQLRQVVLNLVINASEALESGGGKVTLRLRAPRRLDAGLDRLPDVIWLPDPPFSGDGSPDWVTLEVEDDGSGMSPETCNRMFDPFFTTKRSGHGLGLAAVLGIVSSHSGHVGVRSKPGKGTKITMMLMPARDGMMAEEVDEVHVIDGAGRRVLVVDDEPHVRRSLERMLTRVGFEVAQAEDGVEAMTAWHASPTFDLIILDMNMPNMGGAQTHAELRARGCVAPVLLVSGFDESSTVHALTGAADTEFLQKPFEPAALLARAHRMSADQAN